MLIVAGKRSKRLVPKVKPLTMNKRFWLRRNRGVGWVLSMRLTEAMARQWGVTLDQADEMMCKLGREMKRMLIEGYAVGFPESIVVYHKRWTQKVGVRTRTGLAWRWGPLHERRLVSFRLHVPIRMNAAMKQSAVDRGDQYAQYDAERKRLIGAPPVYTGNGRNAQRRKAQLEGRPYVRDSTRPT